MGERFGTPWLPSAREGERVEDLALNEWVGQALGSASMCWADVAGAGEFDSERAGWVLNGLMAHLNGVIGAVVAGTSRAVAPTHVWAVGCADVNPGRVDSLWVEETVARRRAAELERWSGRVWRAVPWELGQRGL